MKVRLNILLKGFTTVELMISLLLMSVVVSLMASLYLNIRSSQRIIEKVNDDFSESCMLYSVLGKDVSESDNIELKEEEILILKTREGEVIYLPLEGRIIRQKSYLSDTIDVDIISINIFKERNILEIKLKALGDQVELLKFRIPKKEASYYINSNLLNK